MGGGDDFLLLTHIQPSCIIGVEPLRVLADELALFAKALLFGSCAVFGLNTGLVNFFVIAGFQAAFWPLLAKYLPIVTLSILR